MANEQYCNVCNHKFDEPVYESPRNISVTSNTEILAIPTRVYWCGNCGHLMTPPLENLDSYYDTGYNILTENDDEDQLYESVNGQRTFRADFQLDTLIKKVAIPGGGSVLDFGSGKGTTLRRLALRRPDIGYSLFEVSAAYIPFWEKFATPDQWATYNLPEKWNKRFDLVISFYVLEHVSEVRELVRNVARVLKSDGLFYFIVPNVYANIGDFVVVDHVNHFSEHSLRYLLETNGLSVVEIDDKTHDSAFIVIAQKKLHLPHQSLVPQRLLEQVAQLSAYWRDAIERVNTFEAQYSDKPAAIYGAGFYGTYIATCLSDLSHVQYFIDQNPHKKNQMIMDKPIILPDELPQTIQTIYVGLNPRKAHMTIQSIAGWAKYDHTYFFL